MIGSRDCLTIFMLLVITGLAAKVFTLKNNHKCTIPLGGIIPSKTEDESFTSTGGDLMMTTNTSGQFVSVDPATNVFYCDGSTSCTQPYAASKLIVGSNSSSWNASTDTSGNLTFSKSGLSTSAMTLDQSGYCFDKKPCIKVYRKGTVNISSATVMTTSGTVTFEYNPSGTSMYSATTGLFTAPYSGVYSINFMIRFSDTSSDRGIKPSIYGDYYIIPSGDYVYWCPYDPSSRRCLTWSDLQYMTKGKQYCIETYNTADVSFWTCTMQLVTSLE